MEIPSTTPTSSIPGLDSKPFIVRILSKPLFISIFVFVLLSSVAFYIDHSTMDMKAERELGDNYDNISKSVNYHINKIGRRYVTQFTEFFLSESDKKLPNLSENTDETAELLKNYFIG